MYKIYTVLKYTKDDIEYDKEFHIQYPENSGIALLKNGYYKIYEYFLIIKTIHNLYKDFILNVSPKSIKIDNDYIFYKIDIRFRNKEEFDKFIRIDKIKKLLNDTN